jgi:crotonobetainyl-CoA:carnitine CoA-transferase CaiB-like acyl-CoA transferase
MRFTSHRLFYSGYHTKRGSLILGALTQQNRDSVRKLLNFYDETDSPDFDASTAENEIKVTNWKQELQNIFMEKEASAWEELLNSAGVPVSVVHFAEEMSTDPQVIAMGMMSDLEHEVTGPQQVVGPIVQMSVTPTEARLPAPKLGSHSESILLEAGFTESEISQFRDQKVI